MLGRYLTNTKGANGMCSIECAVSLPSDCPQREIISKWVVGENEANTQAELYRRNLIITPTRASCDRARCVGEGTCALVITPSRELYGGDFDTDRWHVADPLPDSQVNGLIPHFTRILRAAVLVA